MTRRFRQKSVIVHAIQWTGNTTQISDIREFAGAYTIFSINNRLVLKTLLNEMKAYPGDYIVKLPKEDCYVCRQDVFEELYEPIKKQTDDTGGAAEDSEQNTESEKLQEPEPTEETKSKPMRRRVKK